MTSPTLYVRCSSAGGQVWRVSTGPLQLMGTPADLAYWQHVDTIAAGGTVPAVYEVDAATLAVMHRVFGDRRRWWRRLLDRWADRCRVSEEWDGLFIGRRHCSTHERRWDGGGSCPAAGAPRI